MRKVEGRHVAGESMLQAANQNAHQFCVTQLGTPRRKMHSHLSTPGKSRR